MSVSAEGPQLGTPQLGTQQETFLGHVRVLNARVSLSMHAFNVSVYVYVRVEENRAEHSRTSYQRVAIT